jgi:hypothetical protein
VDLPEALAEAIGLDKGVHGRASFRRYWAEPWWAGSENTP